MKFKIIGRSGYDFYPALFIAEEEIVFIIEAEDLKDLENKLEGVIILNLEGENCILIPESSIPKLIEFIDNPERFWKWWSLGDWVEVGNKKGKLFIVK